MKIAKRSKGKQLLSPSSIVISDWLTRLYPTTVAVPVEMSTDLLLFDFEHELERVAGLKDMSRAQVASIISVMSKAVGAVDKEWLQQALKENGFDTKAEGKDLDKVVMGIKDAIISSVGRTGITGMLIRDVLSNTEGDQSLAKLKNISYGGIQAGIGNIQKLYGMFALSAPVDIVATYLSETLTQSEVMSLAKQLYAVFHKTQAPSVQVKLSYVVDTIFKQIIGAPLIGMTAKLEGYHYEIENVSFVKDLTYGDCMVASVMGLRSIMGLAYAADGKATTISMQSLVQQAIVGLGSNIPMIPEGLSFDLERVEKGFITVFLSRMIERMVTGNFGTLEARIKNVMDSRKYERNEAYDAIIKESLNCSSVVFESFLDATAFFKNMAIREDIFFPDITPKYKKKFNNFVFEFFGQYKNFSLPITHARFLNEPALVMSHTLEAVAVAPDFMVPDAVFRNAKQAILSVADNFNVSEYYKTKVLYGSTFDAELDIDIRVLGIANDYSPLYYHMVPAPDIMNSDLFQFTFGIMRLDHLFKISPIASFLIDKSELNLISSEEEMARFFGLPIVIAKRVFKGPTAYIQLSKMRNVIFSWDCEVAPIYEVTELPTESIHVPSFVAYYPFLVERDYVNSTLENAVVYDYSKTAIEKRTTDAFKKESEKIKSDLNTADADPVEEVVAD